MSRLDDLILAREWKRCSPDWDEASTDELLEAFEYFCAKYVHIRHPKRGKIKFELRPSQRSTVRDWLENRQTIALKARQIGFSTLVSIFCLWLTFFYRDRLVLMVSRKEADAAVLLQHAKYAYRFMPDWMRLMGPMVNMTQTKIEMANDSTIESLPSASDPARGRTAFLIVVDEVGQLPNSEDAWASIEPVYDVGGRLIMLGTANGEGNLLHRLWVEAGIGKNRFKQIFHSWRANSERDDAWYEAKKRELPAWQLAQEYPDNPDEAFLRSGRPVFDVDRLRSIEVMGADVGQLVDDGDGGFVWIDNEGPLQVWEFPQPGEVYVIGADVAEGLSHGDYSSAHVINARTGLVAAHWHGHIDVDLFGSHVLNWLGRWYNLALIGVESNNHGIVPLRALLRCKYPNIYRQRRLDKRNAKATESLGWRTTSASKPLAIDELARAIREQAITLLSAETIAELRTFVRDEDGKMHGSPHDDRVMSLAIAVQMLQYVWLPEYTPKQDKFPKNSWGRWLQKRGFYDDEEDAERGRLIIGKHASRRN